MTSGSSIHLSADEEAKARGGNRFNFRRPPPTPPPPHPPPPPPQLTEVLGMAGILVVNKGKVEKEILRGPDFSEEAVIEVMI